MNQEMKQAIKEEADTTVEFMERLAGAILFLDHARGKCIPERHDKEKKLR